MRRIAPILAVAALALGPLQAHAQGGWKPAEIGLKVGYDNNSHGSVVGGQLHLPVLPSGMFELMPNADITFNPGLRDYQLGVDALFVVGGRRGGLFAGAGYARRSSIYSDGETDREWKAGWDAVFGLRTAADPAATLPIGVQLEMRWTYVDDVYKPRVLTFGVNVPLWGWGRRR